MAKDSLARGARSAQFAAGVGKGKAELKNLSTEPRNSVKQVEIDRKRTYKRIVPKGDMLLIERREPENISAGGVLIPDEGKDHPAEGVILAMGPAVNHIIDTETASLYDKNGYKVGDHIIFGKYAGTEYPWGGETLLFMRQDEIIAVVED